MDFNGSASFGVSNVVPYGRETVKEKTEPLPILKMLFKKSCSQPMEKTRAGNYMSGKNDASKTVYLSPGSEFLKRRLV
jgi:hypothetical protein